MMAWHGPVSCDTKAATERCTCKERAALLWISARSFLTASPCRLASAGIDKNAAVLEAADIDTAAGWAAVPLQPSASACSRATMISGIVTNPAAFDRDRTSIFGGDVAGITAPPWVGGGKFFWGQRGIWFVVGTGFFLKKSNMKVLKVSCVK